MANATLGARIKDLIGFDYTSNSIITEDEALEVACAEMIDSLPVETLLDNAVVPNAMLSGDATFDITGKKVLRVIRYEQTPAIARSCSEIEIEDFKSWTVDAQSLYHPTRYSPVYAIDPETGSSILKVFPVISGSTEDAADTAKVYYVSYPTGADLDTLADGKIAGIPKEAEHAIALRAAMYILDTMISDKIQDDEDQEMMQMLQAQKGNLQQTYQIEMGRLGGGKQTNED